LRLFLNEGREEGGGGGGFKGGKEHPRSLLFSGGKEKGKGGRKFTLKGGKRLGPNANLVEKERGKRGKKGRRRGKNEAAGKTLLDPLREREKEGQMEKGEFLACINNARGGRGEVAKKRGGRHLLKNCQPKREVGGEGRKREMKSGGRRKGSEHNSPFLS